MNKYFFLLKIPSPVDHVNYCQVPPTINENELVAENKSNNNNNNNKPANQTREKKKVEGIISR